jgi:endo-1,4-beta-xylanase
MLSRRAAFGGIGAMALAAASRAQDMIDIGPSLKSLAAAKGLVFGAANNTYWLGFADFAYAYARECAILVPEYELKREITEPTPGGYDFSAGEQLASFARKHGMLLRGHPLVWFAANPPWLDEAILTARDEGIFRDYIRMTATRFAGRMHSWDVVNEAIEIADGRADGLRNTNWLKRFGPSYIDHAFAAAREADPAALLVYNDYGLESDAPDHDARRAATLKLLEGMIARGVPVGALGLQGHITAFGPKINQTKLARFLDEVRATGLRILVTEHDVDDGDGPTDFASRDRAVADASRRMLDVVLDNRATMALLTWGLSDRFLRQESTKQTLLRGTPRKLPFDGAMQPTAMRGAIAQALREVRRG